jgi:hypothetical protein
MLFSVCCPAPVQWMLQLQGRAAQNVAMSLDLRKEGRTKNESLWGSSCGLMRHSRLGQPSGSFGPDLVFLSSSLS